MLRSLVALLTVTVLTAAGLTAAAEGGSELGQEIRVPSNLGFSTNVSPDKQAANILFDNLSVEVSPAKKSAAATHNQTAVQTKVTTLNITYTTDQRSVTMTMDIRGFAAVDPAASARLVACVGGITKVVDLTDKDNQVELKGKFKCILIEEHPDAQFRDWQDQIEFTVQTHATKPVLQVTLFLLVEHDTDAAEAGSALLAVDSLDLEIAKPGKAVYKP